MLINVLRKYMNPCLIELFQQEEKREKIAKGLPIAFDMVSQRMPKGNPAIGVLREHVIIGFFIAEFGTDQVIIPEHGNKRGFDVDLCGHKLSIKTRTGMGGIKILWTSDTKSAEHEVLDGYYPSHDILLVNIFWEEYRKSVFYIPVSVQQNLLDEIGRLEYLKSATGTNNRGIEISSRAIKAFEHHEEVFSIPIYWGRQDITYPQPWDEWSNYWQNLT